MKKIFFPIFVLCTIFAISSCSSDDENSSKDSTSTSKDSNESSTTTTNGSENSSAQTSTESSFSGKFTKETAGYVTWYDNADSNSVAYFVPEIESAWYHCAVSETKYSEIPAGSAIELSANGKIVHLLVTDLCPSSENSKHTSKENYFFDLEKSAFTSLAEASVGELNMTFKVIPYPTSKNIKIQIKDGSNNWWLAFRFYNMRYPLKKVEFSQDGANFSEIAKLDGIKNNWYVIPSGQNLLNGAHYFRLTDIHGQILTTQNLGVFAENIFYDTQKNFPN